MSDSRKLCKLVSDALVDEVQGSEDYKKMSGLVSDINGGDSVLMDMISRDFEELADDEKKHYRRLKTIYKILKCE